MNKDKIFDRQYILPLYKKEDLENKKSNCNIIFGRILLLAKIVSVTRFFIFIYDFFDLYELFDFIYRFSREIIKQFGNLIIYFLIFLFLTLKGIHMKKNQ